MVTNCLEEDEGEEHILFSFNFIKHIYNFDEVSKKIFIFDPSFFSFLIFQFFLSILSFFYFTTSFFSATSFLLSSSGANGKGNCLFSILHLFLFETQSCIYPDVLHLSTRCVYIYTTHLFIYFTQYIRTYSP